MAETKTSLTEALVTERPKGNAFLPICVDMEANKSCVSLGTPSVCSYV
ncbi:hypothetical protein [Cohnella luojiensis]|nr:hypothetical protein [Cohnella luojiensis]